jgi:hypothetical protein
MALMRFEIKSRLPYAEGRRFGNAGAYEQVDGTAHFAVGPEHPANALICDLRLAPRNAAGLVEFTADFSVVLPTDAAQANGRCIVELPNRGRRRVVALMNCAPPDAPVGPQAHHGDGFLFARGYTVASIGWQWDVYPSPELLGLTAPSAMAGGGKPIQGETMVEMRPNERVTTRLLADRVHRPLPAAPGEQPGARLLVRDWEDGEDTVIPRSRWRFARETPAGPVEPSAEHIWLEGGFDPGRIYQLVYDTDRAPVAGLGLLAARDVAAFLRTPSATNPCGSALRTLILYGVSQTGRMQRHFLSLGLNRCEDGAHAYDGFHVHVAGARRGAFNHRFAQPSNQTTPLWGHVFPFADVVTSDPLTGRTGGLLDRLAAGDLPRIVSTDSAAEYWRGDAALAHIDTAGQNDLPEHPSTRRYLFAGTQHTPGYLGQSRTNPGTGTIARYPLNVLDYLPLHRAALINLDRWITEGVEPPPSRHPRFADATAVAREAVVAAFARLPGMTPPDPQRLPCIRTVDMGGDEATGVGRYPAQEGAFYPSLVSAVDDDGNETAGIRLPDLAVPVGTHAGWNPRDPVTGSPEQIVPMNGLTLWFAADEATRAANGDPRRSLAERYRDEADYRAKARAAALQLAADRYLLAEDVDRVVEAAVARYRAAIAA